MSDWFLNITLKVTLALPVSYLYHRMAFLKETIQDEMKNEWQLLQLYLAIKFPNLTTVYHSSIC